MNLKEGSVVILNIRGNNHKGVIVNHRKELKMVTLTPDENGKLKPTFVNGLGQPANVEKVRPIDSKKVVAIIGNMEHNNMTAIKNGLLRNRQ